MRLVYESHETLSRIDTCPSRPHAARERPGSVLPQAPNPGHRKKFPRGRTEKNLFVAGNVRGVGGRAMSGGRQTAVAQGTPGHVLAELFMRPLGLTAYRVAKDLGAAPITISQILRGKRAITTEMAWKLSAYFGLAPQFWLNLQMMQDLAAMSQRPGGPPAVGTCPALGKRRFAVRDVRDAKTGTTQTQVLLVG